MMNSTSLVREKNGTLTHYVWIERVSLQLLKCVFRIKSKYRFAKLRSFKCPIT